MSPSALATCAPGVRSRHVMDWIELELEPVGLLSPGFAHVFERREAIAGIQAVGKIVSLKKCSVVYQPADYPKALVRIF